MAIDRKTPRRATNRGDRIEDRIAALDWPALTDTLEAAGYAVTPTLLTPEECAGLIALYDQREHFRSRVVMERLGFGVGEYKYFAAPLPPLVATLRAVLYPRLAPLANRSAEMLNLDEAFPANLAGFQRQCAALGQTKPTPLMLRYEAGGYNCMHQDLYGELVFPFQLTILLSANRQDFSGGEFLLLEQRPRAQSRAEAIVLEQGQAIIFACRWRAVEGRRGYYRANLRHGVSRVRSGRRFSLGIIFHDAR